MIYFKALLVVSITTLSLPVSAGYFTGEIGLFPEGCQNKGERVCKLNKVLTYHSSRDGSVWQSVKWENGSESKIESGTTDGNSHPSYTRWLLGGPFDLAYLKAAIIHDHYCFRENRGKSRTWQDTHKMYYDALIDLKLNKTKANLMYAAIYRYGPKWDMVTTPNLVHAALDAKECKNSNARNCTKSTVTQKIGNLSTITLTTGDSSTTTVSKNANYDNVKIDNELNEIEKEIERNPNISLIEIEMKVRALEPNDYFFKQENSKDIERLKNIGITVNLESIRNPESIRNLDNMRILEDFRNLESVRNPNNFENIKNLKNLENLKNIGMPANLDNLRNLDNLKDKRMPVNLENIKELDNIIELDSLVSPSSR